MFSGTTGDNYVAVDVEAGFNGHFDVTFKMRTKRANSLLLFVADEDQVCFCYISCIFLPYSFWLIDQFRYKDVCVHIFAMYNFNDVQHRHYVILS